MPSSFRILATAAVLALVPCWACGDVANPTIAAEFSERLAAPDPGWTTPRCRDRAARAERSAELLALAYELRALLREYETPLPPRLVRRVLAADLRGRGDDYRCVATDFARRAEDEPDRAELLGHAANVLLAKAELLLSRGQPEPGWAHVLEALALYRDPPANNTLHHPSLAPGLNMIERLLVEYPPPSSMVPRLIEAVDATRVATRTACSGFRHEMLLLSVDWFRHHFDAPQKQAVAKRFGLQPAMDRWKVHRSGRLGYGIWAAFAEVYDLQVESCHRQPFGRTIAAAAEAQRHLLVIHTPVGSTTAWASDRLVQLGSLLDDQYDVLAMLHTRALFDEHGRPPTTAELALSFGRRPRNPWDGRHYTFAIEADTLRVIRGAHQSSVELRRLLP